MAITKEQYLENINQLEHDLVAFYGYLVDLGLAKEGMNPVTIASEYIKKEVLK